MTNMITRTAIPLTAIAMAVMLLIVSGPISAQDYTVERGEIVLLRQVTPLPHNRQNKHEGPIISSVNMRQKVDLTPLNELKGDQLTDAEAAVIRGAPAPGRHARHMLGTNQGRLKHNGTRSEELLSGPASVNGQLMQSLGGGMSGAIGDQTTTVSEQVGNALKPLMRN